MKTAYGLNDEDCDVNVYSELAKFEKRHAEEICPAHFSQLDLEEHVNMGTTMKERYLERQQKNALTKTSAYTSMQSRLRSFNLKQIVQNKHL